MRKVAVQTIRAVRRIHGRKLLTSRALLQSGIHTHNWRAPLPLRHVNQPSSVLQSSMYFRNFSVALVSTLVASGAWYAYKGGLVPGTGLSVNSSSSSNSRSFTGSSVPANAFSSTSQENANTATHEATNSKRRALVVDDDQFFTEEILGNQPLTKTTDASGRLTVEMLTLQQATQKLRKNEESFLVGRGQGVIRYDTVQLASNNPIEDDHVERIVEGPNVAEAADDEWIGHRDWMFWGVFDGHS